MSPDCQSLPYESSTEKEMEIKRGRDGNIEMKMYFSTLENFKDRHSPPSQTSWTLRASASERWAFEGKQASHSSGLSQAPRHGSLHDRLQ